MNTEITNPETPAASAAQPFNPCLLTPLPEVLTKGGKPPRRPRGKIRRLPPPVRQKLNELLDEGLSYKDVIAALGSDGAHLTEDDVSRWYTTGHQEWLKNQAWLESTVARLDMAVETVADHKRASIHLAALHVASTHLFESLLREGKRLLEENPEAYLALANALTRLSRELVNTLKYFDTVAEAHSEVKKLLDPNRRFTQEETMAVVDRLDRILGFK